MTMKVLVSNDDKARIAKVNTQDFKMGVSQPTYEYACTLGPGEQREFWIHASRRLVIEEQV